MNEDALTSVPGQPEPPKRFVRTFARDLEAVEKGSPPDFATLPGRKEDELPSLSSIKELAESTIDRRPSAGFPLGVVGGVIPEVVAAAAQEREEMLKPNFKAPDELEITSLTPGVTIVEEYEKPTPLHTYKSDFAEQVRGTGASTATVLAAEGDRTRSTLLPGAAKADQRKNILFIAGGAALILLGIGGAYLGYEHFIASAPLAVSTGALFPIFIDERARLDGTGASLAQAIEKSVRISLPVGSVRLLALGGATSTASNVFLALALPAPDILLRNIDPAGGMAGVVNANDTESPFFILSVKSYSPTFAGMLYWEPSMARDLSGLFPPYPAPEVATSSASTTTATAPSNGSPAFIDETLANHDVRVLRDGQKHTLIVYGYWNPTTLIIARDEYAFDEIISRLATSH